MDSQTVELPDDAVTRVHTALTNLGASVTEDQVRSAVRAMLGEDPMPKPVPPGFYVEPEHWTHSTSIWYRDASGFWTTSVAGRHSAWLASGVTDDTVRRGELVPLLAQMGDPEPEPQGVFVAPSVVEWSQTLREERMRQVERGYTDERDREHGLEHLLNYSLEYARHGRAIESHALTLAALDLITGHQADGTPRADGTR